MGIFAIMMFVEAYIGKEYSDILFFTAMAAMVLMIMCIFCAVT